MVFAAGGTALQIEVLEFASRSVPSLLCQEISIVPSDDVALELVPNIAIEDVPGRAFRNRAPEQTEIDLVAGFESQRPAPAQSLQLRDGHSRLGMERPRICGCRQRGHRGLSR